MANSKVKTQSTSEHAPGYAAAYERVQPRLRALSDADVAPVRIGIRAAVTTALAVVPKVQALRDRIIKVLPETDIALIDSLEDAALALLYLDARAPKSAKPPSLAAETEPAYALRAQLLHDARNLASYGLLDPAALAEVRGGTAHVDLAVDITTLVEIFRRTWNAVNGRTPVTLEALDQAFVVGDGLMRSLGLRNASALKQDEATLERNRACTFFLRAYAETRYAVQQVRRNEGDADSIAPSLRRHRNKRRPNAKSASMGTPAEAKQ
jgi:hypothetical protein